MKECSEQRQKDKMPQVPCHRREEMKREQDRKRASETETDTQRKTE